MNCKPYLDYKESGVQWLGEVPEGWEALSLRRLIKYVKTGTTPSGAEEYHFEDGGFNWYSPSDFSDAVYLGAANRALSAEGKAEVRIFPKMTVMLVGIGATIGKVGLAANESSCNQQINAIICNGKLDPIFATYSLKTMRDFIVKCGKFTTMPIINQDETKNLILAVPPIFEQTAIADFLDRETGRIDTLVEKKRRLIALLGEKRTALIFRTVTRGLPADAAREFGLEPHTRFTDSGIEWLGEVPEGWEVCALKRITISRCDGPFGSGLKSEHYCDDGVRVIRLQNIRLGQFDNRDSAFIDPEYYRNLGDHTVIPGDVLIAGLGDENNPVGRACIAPCGIGPAMVKADCFRFRLKLTRAMPTYIALQLSMSANSLGGALATGTTRGRMNLSTTENREIALPPLLEQTAIATYLDRETAKIDQLVTKVEAAIVRLLEYRTALITAAVTGKIDVRGHRHSRACGSPEEVL